MIHSSPTVMISSFFLNTMFQHSSYNRLVLEFCPAEAFHLCFLAALDVGQPDIGKQEGAASCCSNDEEDSKHGRGRARWRRALQDTGKWTQPLPVEQRREAAHGWRLQMSHSIAAWGNRVPYCVPTEGPLSLSSLKEVWMKRDVCRCHGTGNRGIIFLASSKCRLLSLSWFITQRILFTLDIVTATFS